MFIKIIYNVIHYHNPQKPYIMDAHHKYLMLNGKAFVFKKKPLTYFNRDYLHLNLCLTLTYFLYSRRVVGSTVHNHSYSTTLRSFALTSITGLFPEQIVFYTFWVGWLLMVCRGFEPERMAFSFDSAQITKISKTDSARIYNTMNTRHKPRFADLRNTDAVCN